MRMGQTMAVVVQPWMNDEGSCNAGFLREDALLMVTLITSAYDEEGGAVDSLEGNPAYRFRRQKIRRVHSVATIRRSSKYVYETGTTTSVRIVAVVMPPTSVLPKGP